MSVRMIEEERERVWQQANTLGEKGLDKKKRELADAITQNTVCKYITMEPLNMDQPIGEVVLIYSVY